MIRIALITALACTPLVANATAITYEFTGSVSNSTGIYSAVAKGTAVTGTFTFDLANANPSQSQGTAGTTDASWLLYNDGGEVFSGPEPTEFIFSSTIQVAGGPSYATSLPSPVGTESIVVGTNSGLLLSGTETVYSSPQQRVGSGFELSGNGPDPVFSSDGLPLFANATSSAVGSIIYSDDNNVSDVLFDINSLKPVPLPAAVWLMLSGLGGLGVMVYRRGDSRGGADAGPCARAAHS